MLMLLAVTWSPVKMTKLHWCENSRIKNYEKLKAAARKIKQSHKENIYKIEKIGKKMAK